MVAFGAAADVTNQLPKFEDVYKLLRENAVGLKGDELDNAAVRGLLNELKGRASIVTGTSEAQVDFNTNLLAKATIYDKSYVYLRLGHIGGDVAELLAKQFQDFSNTNKVKGLVLDLRFAGGTDFNAAAATADKFINVEQPLLDWGTGSAKSTAKSSSITVPVTVLVNEQTRGAAEALAAAMRETKAGLLLGFTTAGEASIFKEFALENGQKLKIAVSPIKVGGDKALSPDGLKPDIEIPVDADDEKTFMEDPYKEITKVITAGKLSLDTTNVAASAETNQPRTRLNEAELVRRHREGLSTDDDFVDKPKDATTGEIRLIQDPVLSRALDLLKGLAVMQQPKSR